MNVFAKLFTAVRGGVREAAEVVVDTHALRIFEQEIHECESVILPNVNYFLTSVTIIL
jgi:phage shock protein A